MSTLLTHQIQNLFSLEAEELRVLQAQFEPVSLLKGEYYLKPGHVSDKLGFIENGIIREYFIKNDKEVTQWICTPGYFIVDIQAFTFAQPARFYLQCLTDCTLYIIPKKKYAEIEQVLQRWPAIEKTFIVKCFAILEERVGNLLALDAEARYQQLFEFNPELFNTVPLQYLASMMGMTPETLSRLRKKAATMG